MRKLESANFYSNSEFIYTKYNHKNVQESIKRTNEKLNYSYPSLRETEWEYVAAEGRYSRKTYRGLDQKDNLYSSRIIVYGCLSSFQFTRFPKVKDEYGLSVGTPEQNLTKTYDMSGNVSEWCWDKSGVDRKISPVENPKGSDLSYRQERVIKGGNWTTFLMVMEVSRHQYSLPINGYSHIGFRLCRKVE